MPTRSFYRIALASFLMLSGPAELVALPTLSVTTNKSLEPAKCSQCQCSNCSKYFGYYVCSDCDDGLDIGDRSGRFATATFCQGTDCKKVYLSTTSPEELRNLVNASRNVTICNRSTCSYQSTESLEEKERANALIGQIRVPQ